MAEINENQPRPADKPAQFNPPSKINPTAPAGTKNSLGAESVRDGRPATDDGTVEAMDEKTPDLTDTLDR
jgi:hypothetical protein